MNSTSNKAYFRWRTDSGTWNEFISESKDVNEIKPVVYFYPSDYIDGVHTFEFECKKLNAANTMNLLFLDLILQKVGI